MRKMSVVAITAALVMVASLPGMVAAAAPDRVSDTHTELTCETLTADAGTASVYIGVSEAYGSYADLAFWASPAVPYQDPPTWITTFGNASLAAGGAALTASFDLVEYVEPVGSEEGWATTPNGDPVGLATMGAVLLDVGDPEAFFYGDRDGNRRYTVEGTVQQLAADGSLELPGGITFDELSNCWGSRTTTELFATNPDAWVSGYQDRSLSCVWEDEGSSVGIHGMSFEAGAYSEIYVADATGFAYGFTESAVLSSHDFSASYVLETYDELSDTWSVSGTASASASLTLGGRVNDVYHYDNEKVRVNGVLLSVDGLLTLETDAGTRVLSMDEASCFAQDITVQFITTSPASGRGPALANDAPDGAVALESGDAIRVRTGGTALEAEAACTFTDPEYGEFPIPIGHTVWYTVAGTGGAITIDTAGSDFDTVLGVYTSDDAGFTQVACVDDVLSDEGSSLQAAVTFASEAGVTYFVQAGGFAESTGTMYLSAN